MVDYVKLKDIMSRHNTTAPQKSFLWYIVLPDLSELVSVRGDYMSDESKEIIETLYKKDPQANQTVAKRISSISNPYFSMETEKATIGNSYWYYAKQNDIGTLSMEVNEFEDSMTFEYFNAWKTAAINSNGTYNSPYAYKLDIRLLRIQSNKNIAAAFIYRDYFVSGIADINNDYQSNEIVKYSINLTGDSMDHKIASWGYKILDEEQLNKTLSLDSVLPDIESALGVKFSGATGLNLPTIF
jgi:hypothetical protein